jgi:hypothetical protein
MLTLLERLLSYDRGAIEARANKAAKTWSLRTDANSLSPHAQTAGAERRSETFCAQTESDLVDGLRRQQPLEP